MNVKGSPNIVTMLSSSKGIYVSVLVLLSFLSSGECGCVFKGPGKSIVECTDFFPKLNSFSSAVYQLDVHHVIDLPPLHLASSHFEKNPKLRQLDYIRIHNTTLISVDKDAFSGLGHLHHLDISANSLLKSFHQEAVSDATHLTILSLSGNVHLFNQISGPILISESLEELDLSRCELEYLPDNAFSQVKRLSYLNLASNKLTKIPAAVFSELHLLVELDLSENSVSNLPWFMLRNNSLIDNLNLRGNPLSHVPKDIFPDPGKSIIQLDLGETELTAISIPPLPSLTSLNLGGSFVSSLNNFSNFPDLMYLNLSYTKITEIDSTTFEKNPRLEVIRLSGNSNLSLPRRFIGSLSYVELMDISNCGLVHLMPNLFEEMRSIATLNLSYNSLNDSESLGRTLSPLKTLEVLDLSHNKLRVIGEEDFSGNTGMKKLLLSGNPLLSPPSLASTPVLIYLDLSRCTLTRIHLPAIFRQTRNLRYLSLSGNSLLSLNDETYLEPLEDEDSPWSLPEPLGVLDLSDNPWSCDPPFVSLIYDVTKRGVAPSSEPPQRTGPSSGEEEGVVRHLDREWGQLVDRVCEKPHYDVAITLLPLNLGPPVVDKTVTAKFPILLTVGILAAITLASAIAVFAVCRRRLIRKPVELMPPPKSECVKISVSNGSAASGTQRCGQWGPFVGRNKDYQRLKEDRSPSSPETPRIYRPPTNGGHFPFPNVPDSKDPEGF